MFQVFGFKLHWLVIIFWILVIAMLVDGRAPSITHGFAKRKTEPMVYWTNVVFWFLASIVVLNYYN